MKKLLLPILSLMLAAPCLNAGLDSWISSILPEKIRAPKEYRDEFYKLKEVDDIPCPTFLIKEPVEHNKRALAGTRNYFFYSLVRMNEGLFAKETARNRTYDNIQTIAHELNGHVKNRDHRTQWSLASLQGSLNIFGNIALGSAAALSIFSRTKRQFAPLTLIAGFTTKFATIEGSKKIDDALDALEPQSDEEALAQQRKRELAADTAGVIAMAKCGYCKALQELQGDNVWMMEELDKQGKTIEEIQNFRPSGQTNPTLKERYLFTQDALSQCRKDVDPSTTKDTPNLMRNSS
jgi:hypothetical protein